MSKKLKIKKRRTISREQLFKKKVFKEDIDLRIMDSLIREAIPDPEKRKAYIDALIQEFDKVEQGE